MMIHGGNNMARPDHLFVPGHPYFVLLQANNGAVCFHDEPCYQQYLTRLLHSLSAYQVKLHAYVLLPSEVQMLLTPATPRAVSSMMKVVNSAYAHYFNVRFDHCGYPWRGRFRSTVMLPSEDVLECQKYIELAPVRENLVQHPGIYHWSSYCLNAFGYRGAKIVPHEQFQNFDRKAVNRFARYREFLAERFTANHYELLDRKYRSKPSGYHATGMPLVRVIKRVHEAREYRQSDT